MSAVIWEHVWVLDGMFDESRFICEGLLITSFED